MRNQEFLFSSLRPSLGYALRNVQRSSEARSLVDFHHSVRARLHHAQHHSGSTFTFQNLHHNPYVSYAFAKIFFCQALPKTLTSGMVEIGYFWELLWWSLSRGSSRSVDTGILPQKRRPVSRVDQLDSRSGSFNLLKAFSLHRGSRT